MSTLKIIGSADRAPYREGPNGYYALLARHFPEDDSVASMSANYVGWRNSPFLFVTAGVQEGAVRSYSSMLVTTRKSVEAFAAGQINENQLEPYPPGSSEEPILFWGVLILEERTHAPYLVRHAFKQVEAACRAWRLNIPWVYSYAYTKVSERLMRRYQFTKVADYKGKWSIMASKVVDNPYLRALIPNINADTHKPW